MTPDEMRRAAFLLGTWAAQVVPLKDADAADKARRQIREESEYLARLLREEAEAQGWQPIETAPKTYAPPLSPNNHHAPEILGLWGQAFYCVCSWGGPSHPYWIDGNNRKVTFQPTHWRPLPPPPQGREAP